METVLINGIQWSKSVVNDLELAGSSRSFLLNEEFHITPSVLFSDSCWDFYNFDGLARKRNMYVYDFTNCQYPFLIPLKRMVLESLMFARLAASTVKPRFNNAKKFVNHLHKNHVISTGLITTEITKKFFNDNSHRWGSQTRINEVAHSVRSLLEQIPNIDSSVFKYLDSLYNSHRFKAELESGKTPLIPRQLFNKMISFAILDLQNEGLVNNERQVACMIVILAETGMRIGEFARLESNNLKPVEIFNSERCLYLEFKTFKTVQGVQTWIWTKTAITPNVELAYKTLECLREERLKKTAGQSRNAHTGYSEYLYLNQRGEANKYTEHSLAYQIFAFMIKHQDELGLDELNEDELQWLDKAIVRESSVGSLGRKYAPLVGKTFFKVHAHQFRVTCCTRLYELGVPLYWIREHMNHLDEDMTNHYIRNGKLEIKMRAGIELLRGIINASENRFETDPANVTNPIAKRELANTTFREQYEAINAFITKGKYNIKKDLDEVIKILSITKTPITETEEGFCARSALAQICERQEYMSSLGDSYNIGMKLPMIGHAAFSYHRFSEKKKIVAYNAKLCAENPKYKVEYEREKKGLLKYARDKVVPEVNLVKQGVNEMGIEAFIEAYPALTNIARKIDRVLDEVTRECLKLSE